MTFFIYGLLSWLALGLVTWILVTYLEGPYSHSTLGDLVFGICLGPLIFPVVVWFERKTLNKDADYWVSKLALNIGKLNPRWKK